MGDRWQNLKNAERFGIPIVITLGQFTIIIPYATPSFVVPRARARATSTFGTCDRNRYYRENIMVDGVGHGVRGARCDPLLAVELNCCENTSQLLDV